MQHRIEVDGLRAFAVLPVMLFHAGFSWISGGFVGVDVFFVISGFLITAIIRREVSEGRFTLIGFYERRARRILPALFVTLLFCLPFSWALMNAAQFEVFGKSMVAVLAFLANLFFATTAIYFAPSSELIPLLHTWSLAVEEQFYVVFPLLLMVVGWLGFGARNRVAPVLFVIAIVSLALTIYAAQARPLLNFYWPVGRAWELLAGAIAALYYQRSAQVAGGQQAAAWIGFGLLLFSMVWLEPGMPMPSHYSLPPVMGTVLILLAADNRTHVGRLLAFRPFVLIGLISYSAYLFHQPVFVFARLYLGNEPRFITTLGLLVGTLGLTYLSWRLVEEPVRHKAGRFYPPRGWLFGGAGLLMVFFGSIGLFIYKADGVPARMSDVAAQAMELSKAVRHESSDCQYAPAVRQYNVPENLAAHCFVEPVAGTGKAGEAPFVMIIGDSFGGVLADPVLQRLAARGWRGAKLTIAGCASFPGYQLVNGIVMCDRAGEQLYDIVEQQSPDLVIMINRYNFLFNDTGFDNKIGGRESDGMFGTMTGAALSPPPVKAPRGAHKVSQG